jgi:pyruvate formate-lyase/glycerol dehydratase family glycyl radical enzyme
MMIKRIEKLRENIHPDKYPVCTEKIRLVTESFRQTEGEPQILRRAKALAHYLDNKTIFIEDDELIVGNVASERMGIEADAPTWPKEDMEELKGGAVAISDEDASLLRSLDDYWMGKGRTLWERAGQLYGNERLWPFMQSGIFLPPMKTPEEGIGYGLAGGGWGLGMGLSLIVVDYEKVLNEGLNRIIKEAEEELRKLRFTSKDAIIKADFLKSVLVANGAIVRIANRFGNLADEMVMKEANLKRRKELEIIAETCRWVPANPARTFYEAMQSFWFIWMIIAGGMCGGTASGGRFDQFMYPFYKKDKQEGKITDDKVLELLECLRIKVMQMNFIMGGKIQRDKWAGIARWNNWIIGGLTPDGKDATNELSYLILEAAKYCQTPHHTITLRVHEGMPEELMLKALEVVKTGIGMPAFVGDKSYIEYLVSQGVSLRDARNYALSGCLDVNIPGKSRINAIGTFVVALVFEITINNGIEPRTGRQLGPKTGDFESFETFDDFMKAFKQQFFYFLSITAEVQNILLQAQAEFTPDPFISSLMVDAIKIGRDVLNRTMPFENGSSLNPVGMINVANSMAAIKKLVFDEKKVTKEELKAALKANWQGNGHAEIRKMCLAAPKYGNGDKYVDLIAKELYQFWTDTMVKFTTTWGGTMKPSGVSITSYGPGGALTGATPDGRYDSETLADGTMSAAQGTDTHGPTALLRSAMTINQIPFQSTLLNMKFHPSALNSTEDLKKLSGLIKTYFSMGGKHVQFNVVSKETLLDAQRHPEKHRDLIVRVAGYSAYFVQLNKVIQDDIISRMEYENTKSK